LFKKVLKKIFRNSFCQWLFARLHPNFAFGMANFWSRKSRKSNPEKEEFKGLENEWLLTYSKEVIANEPDISYFIFGHRHLPLELNVSESSTYFNLGDWFNWCSYLRLADGKAELLYFEQGQES
jgi:UDP-2,3-diacylglucosamine hydrolase